MSSTHHEPRFPHDARRAVVWNALWRCYFSKLIGAQDCVLDLGCGQGWFINYVVARRRIAVDVRPGFIQHLAAGVEGVVAPVTELGFLADGSIDFAFASNLFEHIAQADLAIVLAVLRDKLSPRGTLAILQPNWRYAYRDYFDDYTHVTVYSHTSMADFLSAHGWDVFDVRPRFLPLTIKSRLPVSPWLIRLYLRLPLHPMGKQMLLRARPRR